MTRTSKILVLTGKNAIRLVTLWLVKLFMLWSTPVFGQTNISIIVDTTQPDTVNICKGDTLNFSVSGQYTLINNNFNSGELGYGWSSVTPNVIFQAPCDTSLVDSYYLWFGEQTVIERELTTLDMDLSGGGEISFSLKFGVQGDIPSCEGPDEAREGVSFQYSDDFGVTWHDVIYFCPDGQTYTSNPGTQYPLSFFPSVFCNWSDFVFTVPEGAETSNTRFRWIQQYCSFFNGHYDDNWGLDNIKVTLNAGPDIQLSSSINNPITSPIVGDTSLTIYAWIMTATVPPDTAAIDSLIVIVHELPQTIISGDNEVCKGEQVTLSASGNYSFTWNNGQTGNTISFIPQHSQQLLVDIESEYGCKSQSSVNITVHPLPVAIPNHDTVCEGTPAVLSASGGISYLWSNGQSGNQVLIPDPHSNTSLVVSVTDENGCSDTTICYAIILSAPDLGLPDEVSVCYGTELNLSVSGWPKYFWSNGSHSSTITAWPVNTTTYYVTVTDPNGCSKTDSTLVLVSPKYETSAYSNLDTVCKGEKVELYAEGGERYEWSTGQLTASFKDSPEERTNYTVTITNFFNDLSCTSELTVRVEAADCYNLFFANAFSPKGYNNIYKPVGDFVNISDYTFMIFDRWGKPVFETTDPYQGWDGTINGQYADDGVYVWKVRFTMRQARRIYEKVGSVLIVE